MATLKISDLSVGDWVEFHHTQGIYIKPPLFDHANAQIVGTHRGAEVSLLVDGKREFMAIPLSAIHPIPITPEILEANGIRRTYEDDNYAIFRGDGLWAVKYSDGDWELSTPPVCRVDIKYVHQLQHALRLAGVDKEITMPKK